MDDRMTQRPRSAAAADAAEVDGAREVRVVMIRPFFPQAARQLAQARMSRRPRIDSNLQHGNFPDELGGFPGTARVCLRDFGRVRAPTTVA
jgi:hypothetical protein